MPVNFLTVSGRPSAALHLRLKGQVQFRPGLDCYTGIHGMPMGRTTRSELQAGPDVALGPHFTPLIPRRRWMSHVCFSDSGPVRRSTDRKKTPVLSRLVVVTALTACHSAETNGLNAIVKP